MFERTEKEPLLFKVGDKIMGYYTGHGAWILVAGEVIKVKQSSNYLHDNEYEVRLMLMPELLDEDMKEREVTFHLPEKDARPFDEVRILEAIKHWRNEIRLRTEASEEHIKMLKLLYPENYKEKEEEKS